MLLLILLMNQPDRQQNGEDAFESREPLSLPRRGEEGTAIELSIGPPSVGRPLPARNERGEGWGEGKSNKNATPLPGPLLLLRRKRGRRARSIRLTQVQWGRGEGVRLHSKAMWSKSRSIYRPSLNSVVGNAPS